MWDARADGFLPPFFWGGYQQALTLEHSNLPNREVRLGGVGAASSRMKRLQKKPHHITEDVTFLVHREYWIHTTIFGVALPGRETHAACIWQMGDG